MVGIITFDFYNMYNQENSIKNRDDIIANMFTKKPIIIQNQLETYAELAGRFSIFPVHYNSKEAAIKKWRKRCRRKHDFTKDSYIDQEGRVINAGIACGTASKLIVLAINDNTEFEKWCNNQRVSKPVPETFTVKTGGDNHHYYFKYPEDDKDYKTCKIPGADIIGSDGYVVAPSSIHPTGKRYIVIKNITIAEPPQWIINVMLQKESKKKHNVKAAIEVLLPAPVITPAAYNMEIGVLAAIIEVSKSRNSYELPTNQIHTTYNDNAPTNSILNSDKSFGRLIVKTLNGYNIQFIKKKLSINGKTPQGIILEQETLEQIKKLLN
jgi:hypothetical protein